MKVVNVYPTRRRCNVIGVKQAPKSSVEGSCQQDHGCEPLLRVLSPLTTSMRIFGLFFLMHGSGGKKKQPGQRSASLMTFSGPGNAYAFVVLIAMWLNAIRLLTMFLPDPGPATQILWRLVALTWTMMAAVVQTSYYRACRSGQMLSLLTFFTTIGTPSWFRSARRYVIILTILAWLKVSINAVFFCYVMFTTNNSPTDDLLAPITTLITPSPSALPIFKSVYTVAHLYVSVAAYLPMAFNIFVAYVFWHHFNEVNRKLRASMKDTSSLVANFESLRRDHQLLSRFVSKADKFICLGNAAYVTVHIFTTICNLYNLIWATDITISPIFAFLTLFWITAAFLGLSAVSLGGIMVNSSAHKIYERIHDIDFADLSSEEIGQVGIFLNRLCGEPIGFSVLRIFVIDRNTILTILGLLITYFLLVIQLAPPKNDSPSATSAYSEMMMSTTAEHSIDTSAFFKGDNFTSPAKN